MMATKTDTTTGVMVCGHGSRDEGAVTEFQSVARGLRERLPDYQVESGFLELQPLSSTTVWTGCVKAVMTISSPFRDALCRRSCQK